MELVLYIYIIYIYIYIDPCPEYFTLSSDASPVCKPSHCKDSGGLGLCEICEPDYLKTWRNRTHVGEKCVPKSISGFCIYKDRYECQERYKLYNKECDGLLTAHNSDNLTDGNLSCGSSPCNGWTAQIGEGLPNVGDEVCVGGSTCPEGSFKPVATPASRECVNCYGTGCKTCSTTDEDRCTECKVRFLPIANVNYGKGDYFSCTSCTDLNDVVYNVITDVEVCITNNRGCPSGYAQNMSSCGSCNHTCAECLFPTYSSACIQCKSDTYLLSTSSQVLNESAFECGAQPDLCKLINHPTLNQTVYLSDDQCPSEYRIIAGENTCIPIYCTPNCLQCATTTLCHQCSKDYYLQVNTLLQYNPSGHYLCRESCATGRTLRVAEQIFCMMDGECPMDYMKKGDRECIYCVGDGCRDQSLISMVHPKLCPIVDIINIHSTLILNGTCSLNSVNSSEIVSVWECFKDRGGTFTCGIPAQQSLIAAIYIGNLSPHTYYFRLNMSAGEYSKYRYFKVQIITEGPTFQVTLASGRELPEVFDSTQEYILMFTSNTSTNISYRTTLTPPPYNNPKCSGRYLKIVKNSLIPESNYTLEVRGSNSSGSVVYILNLIVGGSLKVGELSVTPTTGLSFDTLFTIDLSGWEDASDSTAVIQYKYAYQLEGHPVVYFSKDWVLLTTYTKQFPPGGKANLDSLIVIVYGRSLSSYAIGERREKIKVSPPKLANSTEESTYIKNMAGQALTKPVEERLISISETTLLFDTWWNNKVGLSTTDSNICGGCNNHGSCNTLTERCDCVTGWEKHPNCLTQNIDVEQQNEAIDTILTGILYYIYIYIYSTNPNDRDRRIIIEDREYKPYNIINQRIFPKDEHSRRE